MDIGKALKAVQAIQADAHAAGTVNGSAIDTKGFHEVLVALNAGANGSSGTVDVKVQESDDGSTGWVDITGAAFVQVTESNDVAIYQGRVRMTPTRKRYLRVVAVVGTATCDLGVVVALGDARDHPAATPAFDIHT